MYNEYGTKILGDNMNIEEILKKLEEATSEQLETLFTKLSDKFEELPKSMEEKYLAKKNEKLSAKDNAINDLKKQIEDFQSKDAKLAEEKLGKDLDAAIEANKVNKVSQNDFKRAIKLALSKEENKDKQLNEVIKGILTENKHYTQEFTAAPQIEIIDKKDDKPKKATSTADLLNMAQANKTKGE